MLWSKHRADVMKFSQTDPLGKSFEHEAHLGMDARAGIGMNKGHVYALRIASAESAACASSATRLTVEPVPTPTTIPERTIRSTASIPAAAASFVRRWARSPPTGSAATAPAPSVGFVNGFGATPTSSGSSWARG